LAENKPSKSDETIRKYQRRWIKPTVITLTVLLIPILIFFGIHAKTIATASSNYNSDAGEIWTLIKRNDKKRFFENTPNSEDHVIATTKEDLPEKPYIIAFYLQHCAYCEAAHNEIEQLHQQLLEKYPDVKTPVVHIDVKSPIGKELIHEYDVTAASSLMLMAENEEENMLVISGTQGAYGEPMANSDEIFRIFKELDSHLARYTKHKNQRDRINQ